MKVYLDNEPLGSAGHSLGSALRAAVDIAGSRGRIVVEALADGAAAPDEHLADPPKFEPYAEELRFVSAEPRTLVRTTLMEAADALERTQEEQRRAAELLQIGDTAAAMSGLGEVFKVWESVRQSMSHARSLLGEPNAGAMASSLESMTQRLVTVLASVKQSLVGGDWASLADALEYDLNDQADEWHAALVAFARSLGETKHA